MKVKYKGKVSGSYSLPGGGPQGTLLGLFLFLVLINDLGFKGQENDSGEMITSRRRVDELNRIHLKYVDDLTIAEKVNMKTQVEIVPDNERPLPDNFRDRTGHRLINVSSQVYKQLQQTKTYADNNCMKLNLNKTKLIVFQRILSHNLKLKKHHFSWLSRLNYLDWLCLLTCPGRRTQNIL